MNLTIILNYWES